MIQIKFDIPDKYIDEIKEAFKVDLIEEFKDEIKAIVKSTIRLHREDNAIKEATKNIVIEDDLIH